MADATFDPADFHRYKTENKLDDRTGFDPEEFNSFKDGTTHANDLSALQQMAEKISKGMSLVDNLGTKPLANGANTMEAQGNNLFNQVGGNVAESLGKRGWNPYVAGAAGTAISLLNPQNFMTTAPINAGVDVGPKGAQPLPGGPSNILFTPAEQSGSSAASALESAVAKTPTGAGTIDAFRNNRAQQIQDFVDQQQNRFGSTDSPSMAGNEIKTALTNEQGQNTALSDSLYKAVPKDIRVPVNGFAKTFSSLSDILPDSLKKIVNKYAQVDPNPVNPNAIGTSGAPTASERGIQYHAEPGTPSQLPNAPTVQDLITLRSHLTAAQSEGGTTGRFASLLKQSLNQDIEDFASPKKSALDKLIGEHVNDSLSKATNYYREMKTLQYSPIVKKMQNAAVSDLPDLVFKSGRVEDLQAAQAALGDAGYTAAQKSFFTNLLQSKDIAKEMGKFDDPAFLKQALTENQLQALQTVDTLKKRALTAEKVAPMQGSSRMNAALGIFGTAGAEAARGLFMPAIGTLAVGLGVPYATAKLIINGLKVPVGKGAASVAGLSNLFHP